MYALKTLKDRKIKKINLKNINFVIFFAITWILFAFNTDNADYQNYANAFKNIGYGLENNYFETGFLFLIRLAILVGLNYPVFLAIIATISLLLVASSVFYLTNSRSFVWLLYTIYPFVFDVVQYRNFLAFSIVFFALRFLVDENKKSLLKFVLLVIIATIIHSSSIIYFAFLLVKVKSNKKFISICLCADIVLLAVFLNPSFTSTVLDTFNLDRYLRYEHVDNFSTFYQYLLVYLAFLILTLFKYKVSLSTYEVRLVLIASLFVSAVLLNGTAARLFRNSFVLIYSILTSTKKTFTKKYQILINTTLLIIILFVAWMQLGSGIYYDIVLYPVLNENMLW